MSAEVPRNSFRAAVLRGEKPELVLSGKSSRLTGDGDALDSVVVPRSEKRTSNHRQKDRHRLTGETAMVRHQGETYQAELVNLSAGGAMIRGGFAPKLWDLVELELGEGFRLQAAVRWIRNDLIGVEFAHETQIDCDPKQRAELLLQVIQRSFPDQEVRLCEPGEEIVEQEVEDLGAREDRRHPLIWMAEIHYAFDSNPARLRNISTGGVLVDISVDYPVGAEVLLDLGEAGQFSTIVQWTCGDEAGLRFMQPFDLNCLAKARPEMIAHQWTVPTFLERAADDDSPWHLKWARGSLAEIRSELEGFLKH